MIIYNSPMENKWIVDSDVRLVTFIKKKLHRPIVTSDIEWAIEHNCCRVNRKIERFCSTQLKSKDVVEITLIKRPRFAFEKKRVLYEDEWLLAYDKPAQIASTGAKSVEKLVNLKAVHRLDRDTTGVLLFAKTEKSKAALEDLFRRREIKKSYLAIVAGRPKERQGSIENYLGKVAQKQGVVTWGIVQRGLFAKTEWKIVKEGQKWTLIEALPKTGRTHQVRIHFHSIGLPIIGDLHYGGRNHPLISSAARPLLHAHYVEFIHPFSAEMIHIESLIPNDIQDYVHLGVK